MSDILGWLDEVKRRNQAAVDGEAYEMLCARRDHAYTDVPVLERALRAVVTECENGCFSSCDDDHQLGQNEAIERILASIERALLKEIP
jgi:hypothetical protein